MNKLILALVILISGGVIIQNFVSDEGYRKYRRLKAEKEKLEAENLNIARENIKMSKKIKNFAKDDKIIEINARKELGWVGDKDLVLKITEKKSEAEKAADDSPNLAGEKNEQE